MPFRKEVYRDVNQHGRVNFVAYLSQVNLDDDVPRFDKMLDLSHDQGMRKLTKIGSLTKDDGNGNENGTKQSVQ